MSILCPVLRNTCRYSLICAFRGVLWHMVRRAVHHFAKRVKLPYPSTRLVALTKDLCERVSINALSSAEVEHPRHDGYLAIGLENNGKQSPCSLKKIRCIRLPYICFSQFFCCVLMEAWSSMSRWEMAVYAPDNFSLVCYSLALQDRAG